MGKTVEAVYDFAVVYLETDEVRESFVFGHKCGSERD